MSDSSDERAHTREGSGDATEHEGVADATGRGDDEGVADREDVEELRRSVEEKYDFEDFGPAQMAEMSAEEWDAAFDPDTWITGSELLDRLEADVKHRVITRDVFARVERIADPDRLVAYSDEGYAVVYPDGSIEGSGTVLRDVKPLVALCSMAEYDPPEMPEGDLLPEPMEVPQGSGEFGNLMVQLVAGAQVLAGLGRRARRGARVPRHRRHAVRRRGERPPLGQVPGGGVPQPPPCGGPGIRRTPRVAPARGGVRGGRRTRGEPR